MVEPFWVLVLVTWVILLWLLPDPRPLAAPEWAVKLVQDADSARDLQLRIAKGVHTADFFPSIDGLPEGLSQDEFHFGFGGIGGTETRRLFREIDHRVAALQGLQWLR